MGSSNRPASGLNSQQVPGDDDLRQTSESIPRAKLGCGIISEGRHSDTQKEPDFTRNSREHQPSSDTAAEPTAFEHARSITTQKPTPAVAFPAVASNACSKGGKYYHPNNPKRSLHSSKQDPARPAIEPVWKHAEALLNIPYSSNNQYNERSRRSGPQPGETEWEEIESIWEQKLDKQGFEAVMAEVRQQSPEKYNELMYGARPLKLRPTQDQNEYVRQYNKVLKVTIPTVAFVLTQQHFGQSVDSLNGQEPLTRNHEPEGWGDGQAGQGAPDQKIEIVHHEEDDLEFLDFYGKKSYGEIMLRRRKPVPGGHIHREIPKQTPHLGGFVPPTFETRGRQQPARNRVGRRNPFAAHTRHSGSYSAAKEKEETGILIQSRKGAMYLFDTSYSSFCDLIKRLVFDEGGSKYFIDFKNVEANSSQEFPIDFHLGEHSYKTDILPRLKVRDIEARVRSNRHDRFENFMPDNVASSHMKIVARGVATQFVEALNLLFPQSTQGYQVSQFTVVVPKFGSYNVDRSSFPALNRTIQESLSRVTGLEGQEHNETPAEIFVSRKNTPLPDQSVLPEQTKDMTGGESPEKFVDETQRERLARQLQNVESHQHSLPIPESAYNNCSGTLQSPRYGPTLEPDTRGGHGIPSFCPRVLTLSEIEDLQRRLRLRENELLQREEYCRVCNKTFRHGSSEVEQHYQRHKLRHLCPMCQQDWVELTREDQISHLISSHLNRNSQTRERCPSAGCLEDLADVAQFPDLAHVLEHLQGHVERHPIDRAIGQKQQTPKMCSYPGCHADLALFTIQQLEEHLGTHPLSRSSETTKEIETQTKGLVPGPPSISPEKPRALERLYCDRCFECMQSLSEKRRQNHAEAKCQTTVEAFLLLTLTEAKERKAAMKAAKTKQARKTTPSVTRTLSHREYSTPVGTKDTEEEPVSANTGPKRKRNPTVKANPDPNKRSRKK